MIRVSSLSHYLCEWILFLCNVTIFVNDDTNQSQLSLSDLLVNETCGLTQMFRLYVDFVGNLALTEIIMRLSLC